MEEPLHEIPTLRRFVQLGGLDTVPDATTILNGRRLLETHSLAVAGRILDAVDADLACKWQCLRSGTIGDTLGRWRAGVASWQGPDATAMALDQTTSGSGTGDRTSDCRLRRCRRKGAQGGAALHVLGCATGYNLRWLMRWIALLRTWVRATGWLSLSIVHRWRSVFERCFSGASH